MSKSPILIEIDGADTPGPDQVPPVPDIGPDLPDRAAMQMIAESSRKRPGLGRWILGLLLSLISVMAGVAAWDFVTSLMTRAPLLGYAVSVLCGVLVLAVLIGVARELAGLARLSRVDTFHNQAAEALADNDLTKAKLLTKAITRFLGGRAGTAWGSSRLVERQDDVLDADALLGLAERELLTPIDAEAEKTVEQAARQVATVTALVPLALVDVVTALAVNVRMIRRIAELYGGRAGTIGSLRLLRAVMAHLVATGAVALGDDMLGSLAGGSLLSKLSRRFGEGLVNGALTVRVGLAAMEVCRPLPYVQKSRPKVSAVISRALGGLFQSGS